MVLTNRSGICEAAGSVTTLRLRMFVTGGMPHRISTISRRSPSPQGVRREREEEWR